MRFSHFAVAAAAAIATTPAANAYHGRRAVANGDDVTDPTKYPYFARIDFDGVQACGGSLIHPEFVLSAAHCFLNPDEEVTVFFNTVLHNDTDPSKQVQVLDIANHPAYDYDSGRNDMALIKIAPWNASEPVVVNMESGFTNPGDSVTVMGFGKVETQEFAEILQEVELKITSDEQCNSENSDTGGIHDPSMICALDAAENQDACGADSGGPLVVLAADAGGNQDVIVGVVSSGTGECGQNTASGVYSEVSYHSNWIQAHICQNAENPPPMEDCNITALPFDTSGARESLLTGGAIAGAVVQALWWTLF